MKKLLILLILFVLAGCTNDKSIEIVSPGGAVGITHAQLLATKPNLGEQDYSMEVLDGTVQLSAEFASKKKEIILAPINLGIKFYNNDAAYQLAGVLTWGNLFIASTSEISDIQSLAGKKIFTFGIGSIPYIILQTVLSGFDVSCELENLGDATTFTQQKLLISPESVVLIAEPALTVVKGNLAANKPDLALNIVDLQSCYNELYGTHYPQAGVFVKKSFASNNMSFMKNYLNALKASCDFANSNSEQAATYAIETLMYSQPKAILASSMPRNNIDFKDSTASFDALDVLMDLILEQNEKMIDRKPDEGFYFKTQ